MSKKTIISMTVRTDLRYIDIQSNYLLGRTKRIIDIIGGTVGLLVSALPVLLATIIIKLFDHVPPLYRQDRFGLNGQPFCMYKLKTLSIVETEKSVTPEIISSKPHNPPLTHTGGFWRRTSIDEMPQFWNVIKGEMSLVGHRPFPYYYTFRLKELDISDDELERYLSIISSYKPGLIGYSSVNGRSRLTFKEKMVYDELYAISASVKLDLIILLRAIYVTLTRDGAY